MSKITDLQLALCLVGKECPGCKGSGLVGKIADDREACCACHGSGKVSLLNGVRMPCPRCHGPHHYDQEGCDICGHRGWVPTTDPLAYLQHSWQITMESEDDGMLKIFVRHDALHWGEVKEKNFELGLLKALTKALEAKE